MCEHQSKIAGVGIAVEKVVYLNGRPNRVGYLSSLRLAPQVRNSTVLTRGYAFLRECLVKQSNAKIHLCSIMRSNREALSILTSGRAGLPKHHPLGAFHTYVLPVGRYRGDESKWNEILTGDRVDLSDLLSFLHNEGPRRQFFPVPDTGEFCDSTIGLLRGLSASDLLVVIESGQIAGVLGCWDQSKFRQQVLRGYTSYWRWLGPAISLISRSFGYPPLPEVNKALSTLFAACVVIKNDDARILRVLLKRCLREAQARACSYLVIGLFGGDPLRAALRSLPHLTMTSDVFAVDFQVNSLPVITLDDRPFYLEVGSL